MEVNRTVFIVEEGPNPSTDYFVVPEINKNDQLFFKCNWKTLPKIEALDQATVIFVRYIPELWKSLITNERSRIAHIIYFMDDDLWDLNASSGLPWKYRLKLARHATLHQRWLRAMKAQIWLSTPWLIEKYQKVRPRLISPKPIFYYYDQPDHHKSNQVRLFYHGSASHQSEIDWLYPIVKEALNKDDRLSFEIVGDQKVNSQYRKIDRCTVIHPMKWPTYKSFITASDRHIGLAPSLPHPFNKARSYTKFFDITATGAVGIYAKPGPCQNILTNQSDGIILDSNPNAWIEAILQLADDQALRYKMHHQAINKIHALSA